MLLRAWAWIAIQISGLLMQAHGAGQFYPGMPAGQFVVPQQQAAGHGCGAPAAGGYTSYAPPPAAGHRIGLPFARVDSAFAP